MWEFTLLGPCTQGHCLHLLKFRVDAFCWPFRKQPTALLFSLLSSLLLLWTGSTLSSVSVSYLKKSWCIRIKTKQLTEMGGGGGGEAGVKRCRKCVRSTLPCVNGFMWVCVSHASVNRLLIQQEAETVPLMAHQQQHSQEDHGYSKWNREDHQHVEFGNWLLHSYKHTQRWISYWDYTSENIFRCSQASRHQPLYPLMERRRDDCDKQHSPTMWLHSLHWGAPGQRSVIFALILTL